MTRDSALIYRSQAEAMRNLPPDQFKNAMLAVLDYSMDGIEPDNTDPVVYAVWMMSKPLIDKRNKNYLNGAKRSEHEPNQKRTRTEPEANCNRTASELEANCNRTATEHEPNQDLKEKGERRKEKGEIDLTVGCKQPMCGKAPRNEAEYPYKAICERLNTLSGTAFKDKSKDTRKHIKARFEEGFTLEDFYTVIDKKVAEWRGTDMEKYLRPSTLFGSKFESYLNQCDKPSRETVKGQREYYESDWTELL